MVTMKNKVTNTSANYGSLAKVFHWVIALGIVTIIPLGIIANGMPFSTAEELDRKFFVFSLHKTLGVLIFLTALARIVWAIIQTKPHPLHPERRAETFLADVVHWLLYAALILVPLSGWVAHSAATVAAPIWLPFNTRLPFVPQSEAIVIIAGNLHIIFERVLVVALLLHVTGALKHHFIDRDETLRRILPGFAADNPQAYAHQRTNGPFFVALVVYGLALATGGALGMLRPTATELAPAALAAVQSDWQVNDGTIAIEVYEQGDQTQGTFADWTAAITYTDTADANAQHGRVEVTIAIASLTLGSVTGIATGPEFLEAVRFPKASFTGPILKDASGHFVEGTLTIRETNMPVRLPFDLVIDGDIATVAGTTTISRADFGVGPGYTDPEQVGFEVMITVALTATRAAP